MMPSPFLSSFLPLKSKIKIVRSQWSQHSDTNLTFVIFRQSHNFLEKLVHLFSVSLQFSLIEI